MQCGADFVKVDQTFPKGLTDQQKVGRCASFDGDADRLVYYTTGSGLFVNSRICCEQYINPECCRWEICVVGW